MRITCPNCLAQYEIDATLLPAEGREVQCSACDSIWFQTAPIKKAAKPLAPLSLVEDALAPVAVPEDDQIVSDEKEQDPEAPDGHSEAQRHRSRALDPSVTEVLRQEAEFEAAQRQRDATPVEVQPDLGLLGGSPWPAFRDLDDTPDMDQTPHEQESANASGFPDIDDVSASLDPIGSSRQSDTGGYALPQTAQDRQRSFFRGFIIPIALGGLVVGLYLAAPLLSALVPPAAPVLAEYTDAIDSGRLALAQLLLGQ